MAGFEIWSEITTEASGADGVRHDAWLVGIQTLLRPRNQQRYPVKGRMAQPKWVQEYL